MGKPSTLVAWLHITNACNLRCTYCYLHKTKESMELEHGKLAIDAVFRSAISNGFKRIQLKYAGGEAMLNMKTLRQIHHYASNLAHAQGIELQAILLSNGVALGSKEISFIRENGPKGNDFS